MPQIRDERELSIDDLFEHCKLNIDDTVLSKILTEEQMIRTNYELMQLKDVNISGSSKMKIIQMFEGAINPFVKDDFFRMLIDDRMAEAIKNVKMLCMDVFQPLDMYRRKSITN